MTMEATGGGDVGAGAPSGGDTGGGGSTAPEPGSTSVADALGKGDGLESDGDTPERKAAKSKGGETKAETAAAVARYKALIAGQEVEHDGPTLAKMVADDYEVELTGPGGKPWRGTRQALQRLAQQGLGFEQKMRALTEREQRFSQQVELARTDPKARVAFLMTHLGIDDPDQFIIEQYQQLDQKRQRIVELQKAGKGDEAYRLHQEIIQERMERKDLLERAIATRQQQERQHAQALQQHQSKVREAFEKAGVPFSEETFKMAEAAHKRWAEIDVPKTYAEIAEEVAKEQRNAFFKRLRSIPREKLGTELPEDWRRLVREWELEQAKVAKKEERAAPPAKKEEPASGTKPKGQSVADFLARER